MTDWLQVYSGFWIDDPVGNNAFSFEQRQCQRIFVPPIVTGGVEALAVGDAPAFVEIVDGQERVCPGLKNFIHTDIDGNPAFIFDNHNHAFFFWLAAFQSGLIRPGAILVHVDQHKDTREPESWLTSETLDTRHGTLERRAICAKGLFRSSVECPVSSVFEYTNRILNVGNFIPPAMRLGIFSDVIQVGSREAFEMDLPDNVVLDIDLDIFAPVMSYIPEDVKIERLCAWSRQAALVTMATSPFFIDQAQAIGYAQRILGRT